MKQLKKLCAKWETMEQKLRATKGQLVLCVSTLLAAPSSNPRVVDQQWQTYRNYVAAARKCGHGDADKIAQCVYERAVAGMAVQPHVWLNYAWYLVRQHWMAYTAMHACS